LESHQPQSQSRNLATSSAYHQAAQPGSTWLLETSEISESFNEWNLRIFNEWNLGIFQRVKSRNLQRVKSLNLSMSEILESRNEQNFRISKRAKSQNLGIG
jgi:hypothetical protein